MLSRLQLFLGLYLSPFSPSPNHRSLLSFFNPNSGRFKSLLLIISHFRMSLLHGGHPHKNSNRDILWAVWTWKPYLCVLLKSSGVSLPCYCKVLSCLSRNEGGHLGRNRVGPKQGSHNLSSIYSQQNCLPGPWAGTADLSNEQGSKLGAELDGNTKEPPLPPCICYKPGTLQSTLQSRYHLILTTLPWKQD